MIDFAKPTILFGGSFDPIHLGHLHVVESVRKARPEVRQIIFVPAQQNPEKQKVIAPAELRLEWLNLIARKHGFRVWGTELQRAAPSYTLTTLQEAKSLGASKERLYFLMGADSYKGFPLWYEPELIRALCKLMVVNRPGIEVKSLDPQDIILEIEPHNATSTKIREQLLKGEMPTEYLPSEICQSIKNLSLKSKNPYAIQENNGS